MSCSRSVVLLNNALKIAVMKNGDLSLIQLGLDKEKREITESVIAIYQNELNLLSDVVNLLVKRAVFHKKISSVDELTKLPVIALMYPGNLTIKGADNAGQRRFYSGTTG